METIVSKLWRLASEQGSQYLVFLGLTVIVLILTGRAHSSNPASFQRFFGKIHPLLVVLTLSFVGLVLFSLLISEGQFTIFRNGNHRGILLALGLAVPFALLMMLVDSKAPFPVNINVPFPDSLFFYPVMGYVVELLFHLLPFCLVYYILGTVFGGAGSARTIWAAILVAAVLEPLFQVAVSFDHSPTWVSVYLGLHLLAFNIVQLALFRRYDFLTMYSFRLSYYVLWHILWGYLRLTLLF